MTVFGLKINLMLRRIHERSFGCESFYGIVATGLIAVTIAVQLSGFSNVHPSLLQVRNSKFDGSAWSLLNRPAQKFVHAVESFAPAWGFQEVEGHLDAFHDSDLDSYASSDSQPHLNSKFMIQNTESRIARSYGRKPPTAVVTYHGAPSDPLTAVSKRTPSWITLRAKRLLELLDAPLTHIRGPPYRHRGFAAARQIKRLLAQQAAPTRVAAANHGLGSTSHAVPPAHAPPVSPSDVKRQLSSGGMRLFADQFHPLADASPMRKAR
jgi:hypothetical protein